MDSVPFLETNVFLRHLMQDHEEFSPRASVYFNRIQAGEIVVQTADTVVFETVFTLQRFYRVPRDVIRDALLPLLELPGIVCPSKELFRQVFEFYVAHRSVSYADCYHAVLMQHLRLTDIVSFDRDFDRFPGITRIEP